MLRFATLLSVRSSVTSVSRSRLSSFSAAPRLLSIHSVSSRAVAQECARLFATKSSSKATSKATADPPAAPVASSTAHDSNAVLSKALKKELSEEKPANPPALPAGFKIKRDNPDDVLVELQRNFGNEQITVRFFVPPPAQPEPQENDEMADQYMDSEADKMDPETKEMMEAEDEEGQAAGPYADLQEDFVVLVHRPDLKQTLEFDMVAAEGSLFVNGIRHYRDGNLPFQANAETDFKRNLIYGGPQYDDLDADLVSAIDEWLNTRGINDDLAKFVHEYISYKEQNLYMHFLQDMQHFTEK